MIEATVMRTHWESGAMSYEVKAKGHARAGNYGQDIVCAAVSCLVQTLAAKVDEAAKDGMLCSGSVQYGDDWMTVTATPKNMLAERVAAWFSFVQDGLDAIAEHYPENVELQVHFVSADKAALPDDGTALPGGGMNLQMFAEGASGGAAGAGAEGAAGAESAAAPAVQEPALRPAQERLARRSGALKTPSGSGKTLAPAPSADGGADAGAPPKGEAENSGNSTDIEADQKKTPQTPEERRHAFGALMQGEYSDLFQEALQRAVMEADRRVRADPKLAELGQALSEAYGVDAKDVDGLIDAVKHGRVKDEAYYENLAQERGVSVKTARELDKMENDLRRSNAQNAQLQRLQQEAEHQQRAAQIRAQWEQQAAQLKNQYPDFDLQQVLANPQVADLMRRGVSLPDAYRAAYFNHIMEQAVGRAAQQVEQGVVARVQQRGARPSENGTRPGGAAVTKVDINNTTRRQREELERRVRRGEKITL